MKNEPLDRIAQLVTAEFADDWAPAVAVVDVINREIGVEPTNLMTNRTLDILLGLVANDVIVPGVFDEDLQFSIFGRYATERIEKVRSWFHEGETVAYDTVRWFDKGSAEPNATAINAIPPSSR